jgi:hypothetical protein
MYVIFRLQILIFIMYMYNNAVLCAHYLLTCMFWFFFLLNKVIFYYCKFKFNYGRGVCLQFICLEQSLIEGIPFELSLFFLKSKL